MKLPSFLARTLALLLPGRSTNDPKPQTVRIGGNWKTNAGVRVDADSALKNATVWACIRYLSSTVAQLPWRVYKDHSHSVQHPVDYLLRTRPNPEMSPFAFRETMVGWAVRHGNAIAEIQKDARGLPVALWPIHPNRVSFERDTQTGELLYGVSNDLGDKVYLRGVDVFHIRGFGEGPVGLDVVTYAAESIGWAQATETFGATYFGNGATPSGLLYVEGNLSPAGKDEIEAELDRKFGGAKKAHKTMVMHGKMDYKKFSSDPDAAQFIETRQHQVEEICRWFGVPPHKVMHLLRATFTNIEHQSIEVVVDSITPWCLRFEQEADYKLFGQNRTGLYTKMDMKGLLRGDFKSRQEGLQLMRRNGVINADEWRALEDMEPRGGASKKYIVEGNMTTLEAVGTTPPAGSSSAGVQQDPAGGQQDDSTAQPGASKASRALPH